MDVIELDDIECLVGMRWFSANQLKSINREQLLEDYSAKYFITSNSDERVSLGIAEGSADEMTFSSSAISLCSVLATIYTNATLLMQIDEGLYWGCIISKGVPELDIISKNIDDITNPMTNRFSDQVTKVLDVHRPMLLTNIDENDLFDLCSSNDFLSRKDFRVQEKTFDEISDIIISIKKLTPFKLTDGSAFSGLRSIKLAGGMSGNAAKVGILLAIWVGLGFYFLYDGGDDSSFDQFKQTPVTSPLSVEPSIDLKGKAEKKVTSTLRDQLFGRDPSWVKSSVAFFKSLPDFTNGFYKKSIQCQISTGGCSINFIATTSRKVDAAYSKLKKQCHDVVLPLDGQSIECLHRIDSTKVYRSNLKVTELPSFSQDAYILPAAIEMSDERPGLLVTLDNAETVTVEFKEFKNPGVVNQFSLVGWSAQGDYLHQLNYVIRKLNPYFVTFNYFRLEKQDDINLAFDLRGAVVMQATNSNITQEQR